MSLFLNGKQFGRIIPPLLGVGLSAVFASLAVSFLAKSHLDSLGAFGVYRQFLQFCSVFLHCGGGASLIEFFSISENDRRIGVAFNYHILSWLILSFISIVFGGSLSELVFGDVNSLNYARLPLLFFIITILGFVRGVLVAKRKVILGSVLQFLPYLFILICLSLNLFEDDWISEVFLFSYSLSLLFALIISWRCLKGEYLVFERDFNFEKTSFSVGGGLIFFLGSTLIVKSYVYRIISATESGVLESMLSLVVNMTLVASMMLSYFYLPVIMRSRSILDVKRYLKYYLLFLWLLLFFLALISYPYLELFVGISFFKNIYVFSVLCFAEVFRALSIFISLTLISFGFKVLYFITDIIWGAGVILLVFLINPTDLISVSYCFFIASSLQLVSTGCVYLQVKRKIGFST